MKNQTQIFEKPTPKSKLRYNLPQGRPRQSKSADNPACFSFVDSYSQNLSQLFLLFYHNRFL